jgi:copper transport protein
VPRFSNVALGSVLLLLASGVGASVLHLPTLSSLWQTSYGQAIIVKASLLLAAVVVASQNLFRTVPALRAAEPPLTAAVLLRRLVTGEVVIVAGAVATAAVLSSLPPPPKALATVGHANAQTGPGPVSETLTQGGYRVEVHVTPNQAAVANQFVVDVTRNGAPVRQATVTVTFNMLDMQMPAQIYRLDERSPGSYERTAPALVMVGRWGLSFQITPPGKQPFSVLLVDRTSG